jgi:hypothetical protein
MPKAAQNINAFDLKLLKALLNLKINKSYVRDLTLDEKRGLCKSFSEEGKIVISHDYLIKIWSKENGISHNVSQKSLDQLCGLLRKDYRWNTFIDDISQFRPLGIPNKIPHSKLSKPHTEQIAKAIIEIFEKFTKFEDFEMEVIDKIVRQISEFKKSELTLVEGTEREIKIFAKRIYIELITRKVAIPVDEDNDVIEEIYNSWYTLFCVFRDELKSLPVDCFNDIGNPESITGLAMKILNDILRPHLTEHQAKFRSWLKMAKQNPKYKNMSPQELQKKYPDYATLMKSLKETNEMHIVCADKLLKLIDRLNLN